MKFIKKFEELKLKDTPVVGGKNASLGQMISALTPKGIRIPRGFAVTADAYWYFLEQNNLLDAMKQSMSRLQDSQNLKQLKEVGAEIRQMIKNGKMPDDLRQEIVHAYKDLSGYYKQENCDVAVRSSATAEDLPTASFAGQQETFLNIKGADALVDACIKSMASLFTDRAIIYRIEQGFDHFKVALSVGVQKMIRSDLASSGVIFTLDTETGFKDIVLINSSWGLGEAIVKGEVIPDEFVVHKPTLEKKFSSIIKKQLGDKIIKIVYADNENGIVAKDVSSEKQHIFSLTDQEILELARVSVLIERHYSDLKGGWSPMDIEWAKDGYDGKLYILQARPETVYATKKTDGVVSFYRVKDAQNIKQNIKVLVRGDSIGNKIATGRARVIESAKNIDQVQEGEILVTRMTDPDWVPAMKKAAGIITDKGGRTCHAAIVSRELRVVAIVGTQNATKKIVTGQEITIDCSQGKTGFVYDGVIDFERVELSTKNLTTDLVFPDVMINIADPDSAFSISFLPNDGVGLARIEFIINNAIKIHPMALVHPEKVKDNETKNKIMHITRAYTEKTQFFVDQLSYGIATIAAAFYPKPVIVRFSDFKTNEYRNLIGGIYFEPEEENPMLGFRGASRYYNERYKDAFALECEAIKKVRNQMGLTNVKVMVPFVRTLQEAKQVLQVMKQHGLQKGQHDLEIVMMCEIPSNVLLIEKFSTYFDGFSIGSNDLTQLTLGVDRDSEILSPLFDERDEAVKKMMQISIQGALAAQRYIGICGQAPSDLPEIANFVMGEGITSISLNQDAVVPFLMRYAK